MRITKFGHACLYIEEGSARLLIDPGSFSHGFEDLSGLSAVLYTHQHGDHLDEAKLKRIHKLNPEVRIITDEGSAEVLKKAGYTPEIVHDGDVVDINGVEVRVIGSRHAQIHASIPTIPNVGYMVADRFFYPGDALTVPERPVGVLALPVEAPWTKVGEVIDYLLEVRPPRAIPAHESVSAVPEMQYGLIGQAAKVHGIAFETPAAGEAVEA
jgi:L-ascorbate metabolism protein UlaG (beta-lactamase superfamily)